VSGSSLQFMFGVSHTRGVHEPPHKSAGNPCQSYGRQRPAARAGGRRGAARAPRGRVRASFSTSLDAPRSTMVHALGASQSTMNVKNSSPSLTTSNMPARVPMSLSRISSTLRGSGQGWPEPLLGGRQVVPGPAPLDCLSSPSWLEQASL